MEKYDYKHEDTMLLLNKSLQDGYDTLNTLNTQKEKLQRSKENLNKIDYYVSKSNRILDGMKSFFSSFKNLFCAKIQCKDVAVAEKPNIYPRGWINSNEIVETPLDQVYGILNELEEVAYVMNDELTEQNTLIENIQEQSYDANDDLKQLVKKGEKLLR